MMVTAAGMGISGFQFMSRGTSLGGLVIKPFQFIRRWYCMAALING